MQPVFSFPTEASNGSRITRLQAMLKDQKADILMNFNRNCRSALKNSTQCLIVEKYQAYEEMVKERVKMAENFVNSVTDIFFCMLEDSDCLTLTT